MSSLDSLLEAIEFSSVPNDGNNSSTGNKSRTFDATPPESTENTEDESSVGGKSEEDTFNEEGEQKDHSLDEDMASEETLTPDQENIPMAVGLKHEEGEHDLTEENNRNDNNNNNSSNILSNSSSPIAGIQKLSTGSDEKEERPSLSYKDLIIEAIESSPEKRLKLSEIYQVKTARDLDLLSFYIFLLIF